ncbi:MAG: hypothetical protein HFK04_03125 [Oscillospiraceae bacterium]|nr:hypothetical protein [Oscillospiraceae bacterium]
MKHDLEDVYRDLEKEDIAVLPYRFQHIKSVSLAQEKVVGIDRSKIEDRAEEYTILIHEKGHFDAGAFYTPSCPCLLREQAECRADRAAILRYIPLEELREVISQGLVEIWELAERFGVTEAFMKKAVSYYRDIMGESLQLQQPETDGK